MRERLRADARIRQRVVQRDRLEDGAELVIAVGTRAEHAQRQIDLGGRVRLQLAPRALRASPFRYGPSVFDASGPDRRSSSRVIGADASGIFTRKASASSGDVALDLRER